MNQALKTSLNDVRFEDYHVFRADARVLTAAEASQEAGSQTEASAARGASANEATRSESAAAKSTEAASATSPEPLPPAENSATATEPVPQEALNAGTNTSAPPNTTANIPQTPIYKTTVRDVVVDVVVTKGSGDPVPGLGKQDFAVAENGKAQAIDFF